MASGHAGLGAAKRLLPQVITLDLGLPDLDGWEVLYRLKNDPATQGIPVLVVTAQDQGQLGPSLGAVDWLTKPVDSKRLLTALRRCQALGAPRRPLRILIVDDEATVLEALEALLAREGHRIIRASDGQSALKRAQAELPDIVLLCVVDVRIAAMKNLGDVGQPRDIGPAVRGPLENHLREQQQAAGEDDRHHAGLIDPQRQVLARAAVDAAAADVLGALRGNAPLALGDEAPRRRPRATNSTASTSNRLDADLCRRPPPKLQPALLTSA